MISALIFPFFCSILSIDSIFNTLGGTSSEYGFSVQETFDGGFIVSGKTRSFGAEGDDVLLVKYYSDGILDWAITLGGRIGYSTDAGYSVEQTIPDGGYIVAGYTYSFGVGKYDVLLAKFNSSGSMEWVTTLGGSESDYAYSVQQTVPDGGYIVTGKTESFGAGVYDVLLAKFNSNGTLNWTITLGGANDDIGFSVQQTIPDGGYIVTGETESFGAGEADVFLAKFCPNGSLEWVTAVGGGERETGKSVKQTIQSDGGYVVVGHSASFGYGDDYDIFLLKFFPNGTLDWAITIGGDNSDFGNSVGQTFPDGGYILTGSILLNDFVYESALIAKVLRDGSDLEWAKRLDNDGTFDYGRSVQQTSDGGFIVSGEFDDESDIDIFLAKVDENGNSVLKEGCSTDGWVDVYSEINVLKEEVISFYVSSESISHEFQTHVMNSSFVSFHDIDFQYVEDLMEKDVDCTVYPNCYGVDYFDSAVCSGHGECFVIENGICECDEHYFGLDCNVTLCNGTFSNETEIVCSGRGVCTEYDKCENCTDDTFGPFCDLRQYPSFFTVFGGNENDFGYSVQQTFDGGYIVVGRTVSFGSGDYNDILLVKFQSDGTTVNWANKIYYGSETTDFGNSVQQTVPDGGYIITGVTDGGEGIGSGSYNILLAKLFPNGSLEWATVLGGDGIDEGESVQQTFPDGGYIVTGSTKSFGDVHDLILCKFYPDGGLEWVYTVDGGENDYGYSVQQTVQTDGGFIVTGRTESSGVYYLFLLKFQVNGTLEWATTLGGSDGDEEGYSVQQTVPDGGYIVTGYTESFGYRDIILAKFFSNGYLDWFSKFTADNEECGYSVQQSFPDGGYMITGQTSSYGAGSYDILLAKFDSDGILDWASTLGRDDGDVAYSVQQTYDGGFVVAGFTDNYATYGYGMLLAKVYVDGKGCENSFFERQPDAYSEFVDIFADPIPIDLLSVVDRKNTANFSYITPVVQFIDLEDDEIRNPTMCSIEFSCFGTAAENEVCSTHGECIGTDVCSCESDYYGDNCEVTTCFGIFSNYTMSSAVCSGHGECIDLDHCECDSNYTTLEDCSYWKCFGKWMNDSTVCNGEIGNGRSSYGICTSLDHCDCEVGYQETLSCDWECYGDSHWVDEACGHFGTCVDYDTCECESDYGLSVSNPEYCDWWTCYGIHWNEYSSVCSGNGDCLSHDECSCNVDFVGDECDSCDRIEKGNPQVCSGNGECVEPNDCECGFGHIGEFCGTNILYATVMAPVLSISGILGVVTILLIVACCCVCCLCVYCCAAFLVIGMVALLLSQLYRFRKLSKLKNIDILLQEQEADENTDIAHIRD